MTAYLLHTALAHLRKARSLYALTIVGVSLGVASVFSIQIINRNALAAFRGSVQAVSGSADLSIMGRTPFFPESLYVRTLATLGVKQAWPILRLNVAVASQQGSLELIGTDLLRPADVPFDTALADVSNTFGVGGWLAVTPQRATAAGWEVGDTVRVSYGSLRVSLPIGRLIDFQSIAPYASSSLAVTDLSQLQGLFGLSGVLSQIDVQVFAPGERAAVAASLGAALGDGVDVLTPEQREQRTAGLVSAFQLNLTALSLISLFVGLFLVFSSTQASLVRRRTEFGVLRALGATRGQVLVLILAEVAALGVLGIIIGLPLGYWIATANVGAVSATLSNLYLLREIERLELPIWLMLAAAGIGVLGAVVGALIPALDMSRRDPNALLSRYTLHEPLRRRSAQIALLGLGIMAASGLWYLVLGQTWQPAGFVLALALLMGLPLVTPWAVRVLAEPFRADDFGLRFSVRSLAARTQTTAVAVACLAVAVSMLSGITMLVGSFRETVQVWIGSSVQADIYITSESWARSSGHAPLDSQLVSSLTGHPLVTGIDRLRSFFVYMGTRRISLAGVDMNPNLPSTRFPLLRGDREAAGQRVHSGQAVFVSEPLARKANLWVGDTLEVTGSKRLLSLEIAGVYYDYSSEAGAAVMDLAAMQRYYGPDDISSLALYLDPGADVEAVVDELRVTHVDRPLLIRSNRTLRQQVFRIFDQTFAITRILQILSLIIAASGITLTLLILARERLSELALYRALGAARHQIFVVFLGKGAAMGVLGVLLGLFGGLGLSFILIYVINRAYFGWTIQRFWPWQDLGQQMATIVVAAIAASIYPAVRASRAPATELSREDL